MTAIVPTTSPLDPTSVFPHFCPFPAPPHSLSLSLSVCLSVSLSLSLSLSRSYSLRFRLLTCLSTSFYRLCLSVTVISLPLATIIHLLYPSLRFPPPFSTLLLIVTPTVSTTFVPFFPRVAPVSLVRDSFPPLLCFSVDFSPHPLLLPSS